MFETEDQRAARRARQPIELRQVEAAEKLADAAERIDARLAQLVEAVRAAGSAAAK